MSAIDLDPTDAKAYLKAAKAEAGLKNHDHAMAFCQRAADLQPNDPTPYANALAYAEFATDVKTDVVMWAADSLLKPRLDTNDGIDYHAQAKAPAAEAGNEVRRPPARTPTSAARRHRRADAARPGDRTAVAGAGRPRPDRGRADRRRWRRHQQADHRRRGAEVRHPRTARTTASEVYTAAQAFSGTYRVTVKQAFGKADRRQPRDARR